ncbi:MAG: LpqB family beta-propeller domain-containing protein, partial [Acidobacteriota bacterium]
MRNRVFEFEDFRLDADHKLLYRGGEQVVLTPKAVETLIALVDSRGNVISKEDLMQTIWADTIVEDSNLAQYLHVLRKTLGETNEGKPFIETLKRRGYRFNGTVRVVQKGNGLAPQNSDRGKFESDSPNGSQRVANTFSRRVERHGNVLAVAEWIETEERVDTIDHKPAVPVDEALRAMVPHARSKWLSPLVAGFLVAGLAGIVFGIYKFTTNRSPSAEAQNIPFRGSEIKRLTTSGKSKQAAISPDGKYVAHVMADAGGDSLWIRQVAVANETRIAGPSQSDFVWVTFAPDGDFIYYLTLERDKGEPVLFRVPVLGGPIAKVLDNIAPPTFSPDGTRMAFMNTYDDQSRLIVANADGTDEAVLVTRRDPDYLNMVWYAPAWSLDGKSIAFPVNQSDEKGRYETVLAVDVETRVERKLTEARWQQVGQPRWISDGLLVTASETSTGPKQLWNISLPDGAASRVTLDLNNYENLSLTSEAKTLAVIQDNVVSNIWTVSENAAGAKQILSEAGRLNELIWLPDGRLAYTSNAGGSSEIWTMNADGTNIRQLTVGANARLGLAVTADEKQIVFA